MAAEFGGETHILAEVDRSAAWGGELGDDSASAKLGREDRIVFVPPASRRLIFGCLRIKTCRRDAGATANAQSFVNAGRS